MIACKACGEVGNENKTSPQTFANGTVHMRVDCGACGKFIGYHKQGASPYRERLFKLAVDLSKAEMRQSVLTPLIERAQQLVAEANNGKG